MIRWMHEQRATRQCAREFCCRMENNKDVLVNGHAHQNDEVNLVHKQVVLAVISHCMHNRNDTEQIGSRYKQKCHVKSNTIQRTLS